MADSRARKKKAQVKSGTSCCARKQESAYENPRAQRAEKALKPV